MMKQGRVKQRHIHKQGQMEMIGLVFVVVIIVIGIILYMVNVAKQDTGKTAQNTIRSQQSPSFVTALAATTMPTCDDLSVSTIVEKCVNGKTFCNSGNPCQELKIFLNKISEVTLKEQGVKYNLSIEGTDIMSVHNCNNSQVYAGKPQQIPVGGGEAVNLVLKICK